MMTGAGGAMLSLYKLEQAVTELPIEELPNLIGDLARLQAKANARLYERKKIAILHLIML